LEFNINYTGASLAGIIGKPRADAEGLIGGEGEVWSGGYPSAGRESGGGHPLPEKNNKISLEMACFGAQNCEK